VIQNYLGRKERKNIDEAPKNRIRVRLCELFGMTLDTFITLLVLCKSYCA